MKRKYFIFDNEELESPEVEVAFEAMTSEYLCINDDDDGAPQTIYCCDAEIETPQALMKFMSFSPETDKRLDGE